MAPKFVLPPTPPQVQDLPICFHPGCTERAPYGNGATRRSFGRHFCARHRPDAVAPAAPEVRDGR